MRFMLNPLLSWLTVQGLLHAEMPMPRASWKGFLRLSLVSCPVYLSPATSRTKSIRLNQVWVPRTRPAEPVETEEDEEPAPISRGRGGSQGAAELAAEAEEEPA